MHDEVYAPEASSKVTQLFVGLRGSNFDCITIPRDWQKNAYVHQHRLAGGPDEETNWIIEST